MCSFIAVMGLAFLPLCTLVYGHARLRIPPQRSSLWREGLSSLINRDDNELNCGGFSIQHGQYNGKCGVCGDIYGSHQFHQPPGKYAQGIIGRCYKPGIRWIDVKVEITANHLGYFQFKLCANNNIKHPVSQTCLDSNVLTIRDKSGRVYGTRFPVNALMLDVNLQVQLPDDIKCSQCVLQWIYTTGNNWGCFNGKCRLGHGSQETFINCADIAITNNCPSNQIVMKNDAVKAPASHIPKTMNCVAVGIWARTKYTLITEWCRINCHEVCPPDYCKCY
ncbi:hypothetical protein SNE40_014410 [Patella caerulea]|uniref:Chitin-binding type-4 domain-containing protein n=1 Tax=Patella caerulea TaxID=87958 RepID=A0AAN8JGV7_PATCE